MYDKIVVLFSRKIVEFLSILFALKAYMTFALNALFNVARNAVIKIWPTWRMIYICLTRGKFATATRRPNKRSEIRHGFDASVFWKIQTAPPMDFALDSERHYDRKRR